LNEEPAIPPPPRGAGPARLVEHFFRHETGRLHGALVRLVGIHNLALAEDVAQEAMLRAMRAWSMGGIPANPSAWITRVAINLARDAMRHGRMANAKEPAIVTHHEVTRATPAVAWEHTHEIRDDALRLMFVCCHPAIAPDAQIVLALKILCGFSTGEIARAFFGSEAAIEKQLTRTKQRIADSGIAFELPPAVELEQRIDGVLATLYLLFNEGHTASSGDRLLRADLCAEAIRLAEQLVAHPVGDLPRAHALLALMLLTAARFPARVSADGALLRLEEQDRTLWNRAFIDRGLDHLARSAGGESLSEYHLQAGIAALHATARDAASTDWASILRHYDALCELRPSPVVHLNRAVALAYVRGPRAALDALASLPQRDKLESNHLLSAVTAEMHLRLGEFDAAERYLRLALDRAKIGPERDHLARSLERVSRGRIGAS
jgi:RNA polymerase sigma-70 factor (ECF subfamily)